MTTTGDFPPVLFASDDFGAETYIFSPEQFKTEIDNCIESGFSDDFDPDYIEWEHVGEGIYTHTWCGTRDGNKHQTRITRARMTWHPGRSTWVSTELDE